MSISKSPISNSSNQSRFTVKGLAPASVLHFRCDDGTGNTMTDSVSGVVIDNTANGGFTEAEANSLISAGGQGKMAYTNKNAFLTRTSITSGTIIIYSTAIWSSSGSDTGNTLAGVFDADGTTGGVTFHCENQGTSPASSVGAYAGDDLATNAASISLTGNDRFHVSGLVTHLMRFKFGVPGVYMDVVSSQYPNGKTYTISSSLTINEWDMTTAHAATRAADIYSMGCLHIKDTETIDGQDFIDCCKHHYNNPTDKDVWSGWLKYNGMYYG